MERQLLIAALFVMELCFILSFRTLLRCFKAAER